MRSDNQLEMPPEIESNGKEPVTRFFGVLWGMIWALSLCNAYQQILSGQQGFAFGSLGIGLVGAILTALMLVLVVIISTLILQVGRTLSPDTASIGALLTLGATLFGRMFGFSLIGIGLGYAASLHLAAPWFFFAALAVSMCAALLAGLRLPPVEKSVFSLPRPVI